MIRQCFRDTTNPGSILDIACASGVFTRALYQEYPSARVTGIELSSESVNLARSAGPRHIRFEVADAVEYQPDGVFDLVVASGILSIWEDFRVPLSRWCEWLSPLGVLHIFGRFNSDNVDTITRFREGGSLGVWESGFTSYSIGTVGEFLKQQGYSCSFEPFVLQRDIERSASPIATFTVQLKDGGRLVLNGANIRAEHFFLTVTRRHAVKR